MKEVKKRSECPVSFSLDFLGDKWTLLIIRDLVLNNKTTFGDFLGSDECIATNILTDRLKMLESNGFIYKYPVLGKARTAYCLTDKGIGLVPLVIEMALWGAGQDANGYDPELGIALRKDKAKVIRNLGSSLAEKYKSVLAAV